MKDGQGSPNSGDPASAERDAGTKEIAMYWLIGLTAILVMIGFVTWQAIKTTPAEDEPLPFGTGHDDWRKWLPEEDEEN